MESVNAFLDFSRRTSSEDQTAWGLRGEGFRGGVSNALLVDAGDEDGTIFDGLWEGTYDFGCFCLLVEMLGWLVDVMLFSIDWCGLVRSETTQWAGMMIDGSVTDARGRVEVESSCNWRTVQSLIS